GLAAAPRSRECRLKGASRDERRASPQADRPFRRQHPVAGRRDSVPYSSSGDRTTPEAPAGRRDSAARPGDRQDRGRRYRDRVVATVRPPAAGRRHPRWRQVPDLTPTPIAPTYNNMVPTDRPALIPLLTTHMLGEVTAIAQALPNDRIALQWDVCQDH